MKQAFWLLLLAALAVLAAGSELDRAARQDLRIARMVPGPFQSFALAPILQDETASDTKAKLLADARRQILLRPIPAESLSALAVAQELNGQTDAAARTIATAGPRGWRDPVVQMALADSAFTQGQWDVAAKHLGALYGSLPYGERPDPLVLKLLSRPEMVDAMARLLGQNPNWAGSFVSFALEKLPGPDQARLVKAATASGAELDCKPIAAAARRQLNAGAPSPAAAMWFAGCGARRGNLAAGLQFEIESPGFIAAPFDWEFPDSPDLDVTLRESNGGVVLDYELRADLARRTLATKLVTLRPGTRMLSIVTPQGSAAPLMDLDLRCRPGNQAALKRTGSTDWQVSIPEQGCEAQRLSLIGQTGRGEGIRIVSR